MGVNLTNDDDRCTGFSDAGWSYYRALAEAYGWRPAGTLPPRDFAPPESWSATYEGNQGQWVSAEDGRALGAALQRARDDPGRFEKARPIAAALEMDVPTEDDDSLSRMIYFFEIGRFQLL